MPFCLSYCDFTVLLQWRTAFDVTEHTCTPRNRFHGKPKPALIVWKELFQTELYRWFLNGVGTHYLTEMFWLYCERYNHPGDR